MPASIELQRRLRWADADAAGRLHFPRIFEIIEEAESELVRSIEWPMDRSMGYDFPRVHLECDFHQAAQLDDLLEVSVYIGSFGNKSMRLDFEVRRKGLEAVIADAHFVLAAVRRDTFETLRIPDELRERLALYVRPGD